MLRDSSWTQPGSLTWKDRSAALDRYKAYRAQVEHEDELMGIRMGWLIGSEAFLFAGYASVVAVADPKGAAARLLDVLPALGIAIAVLVSLAMGAAIVAVQRLRHTCPTDEALRSEQLPPMISGTDTHVVGLIPAFLLPFVLIAAWLCAAL